MLKSLYKIETEYLDIAQQLIEGEATPELLEALAINEQELQAKSTNYAYVIKQMEGEAEIIEKEIARLTTLKKARENAAERLREAVKQAMELYAVEEIKTPLVKINFRKSESVEILDSNLVEKRFVKVVTEEKVDKVAIKEAIKAGETVVGATLKQNKNLQIK